MILIAFVTRVIEDVMRLIFFTKNVIFFSLAIIYVEVAGKIRKFTIFLFYRDIFSLIFNDRTFLLTPQI